MFKLNKNIEFLVSYDFSYDPITLLSKSLNEKIGRIDHVLNIHHTDSFIVSEDELNAIPSMFNNFTYFTQKIKLPRTVLFFDEDKFEVSISNEIQVAQNDRIIKSYDFFIYVNKVLMYFLSKNLRKSKVHKYVSLDVNYGSLKCASHIARGDSFKLDDFPSYFYFNSESYKKKFNENFDLSGEYNISIHDLFNEGIIFEFNNMSLKLKFQNWIK